MDYSKKLIINHTVSIIGAGGWGTALAIVAARNGYDVILFAREAELVEEINTQHTNSLFLPNIILPENIKAVNSLDFLKDYPFFISAIPTQFIRRTYNQLGIDFSQKKVVNVAKGIEIGTLEFGSKIFGDLGISIDNFAVLTGPSHAEEVARLCPTTVVTSGRDEEFSHFIQKLFSNEFFRVYRSNDVIGCELGGSLKNIIALAAGIIDGLQMGDNTKAALITRGLAEITRISVTLGAEKETLSGLAGLGDLIVTCASRHSRNRKVGQMIGEGSKLSDILSHMQMVVEGVATTQSAYDLSRQYNVEIPIIEKVHQILFENLKPRTAIKQLMTRSFKHERN